MAVDTFLKLDGIAGESMDNAHPGEIDIQSFSWGESQLSNAVGGGHGAGKVSMQDIHFTTEAVSKASPQLFLACASGKHIPSAILTMRDGGTGGQLEFLKIKLADVLVSSFSIGSDPTDTGFSMISGNGVPSDQFSLNFTKIEIDYTSDDGSLTVAGWDIRKHSQLRFAP